LGTSRTCTRRYADRYGDSAKDADQRHADLELMIEQFRVAEKRALIKRGVKLWTRAEAERARASVQTLEPDKIN